MRISPTKLMHGLLYLTPVILLTLASCGGGGGGGGTTTPLAAPSIPAGVTASTGCSAINLNWNTVAGATGYNVYHAASGASAVTTTTVTNTSYTDAGLRANTYYNYQVQATNSAGVSSKSNTVSKQTGAACTDVGGSIQGTTLTLSGTSTVSTMAGAYPFPGYVDSSTGVDARFDLPANVATDGLNLYVADAGNNVIREIAISNGAVTTLAGSINGASGVANAPSGPGTSASFNAPQGITTDGTFLYVADTKSGTIRKIAISNGAVTTIASGFSLPAAITTDGLSLYVADTLKDQIVKLDMTGVTLSPNPYAAVTSPQGITYNSGDTDLYVTGASGVSQITSAQVVNNLNLSGLNGTQGITTDGANLYVTNSGNGTILKIATPAGTPVKTTIAGTSLGYKDGTATAAQFRNPYGITTDGANLYIVDTANLTIRKIQ
jgi:sugar lactone lactonase YvrE